MVLYGLTTGPSLVFTICDPRQVFTILRTSLEVGPEWQDQRAYFAYVPVSNTQSTWQQSSSCNSTYCISLLSHSSENRMPRCIVTFQSKRKGSSVLTWHVHMVDAVGDAVTQKHTPRPKRAFIFPRYLQSFANVHKNITTWKGEWTTQTNHPVYLLHLSFTDPPLAGRWVASLCSRIFYSIRVIRVYCMYRFFLVYANILGTCWATPVTTDTGSHVSITGMQIFPNPSIPSLIVFRNTVKTRKEFMQLRKINTIGTPKIQNIQQPNESIMLTRTIWQFKND